MIDDSTQSGVRLYPHEGAPWVGPRVGVGGFDKETSAVPTADTQLQLTAVPTADTQLQLTAVPTADTQLQLTTSCET